MEPIIAYTLFGAYKPSLHSIMSTATRLGLNTTGLSLDRNLSLYTLPAVFLTAFVPHTIKVIMLGKRFDNANPRGTVQTNEKDTPYFKDTM